jgi:hypothetical protein
VEKAGVQLNGSGSKEMARSGCSSANAMMASSAASGRIVRGSQNYVFCQKVADRSDRIVSADVRHFTAPDA